MAHARLCSAEMNTITVLEVHIEHLHSHVAVFNLFLSFWILHLPTCQCGAGKSKLQSSLAGAPEQPGCVCSRAPYKPRNQGLARGRTLDPGPRAGPPMAATLMPPLRCIGPVPPDHGPGFLLLWYNVSSRPRPKWRDRRPTHGRHLAARECGNRPVGL